MFRWGEAEDELLLLRDEGAIKIPQGGKPKRGALDWKRCHASGFGKKRDSPLFNTRCPLSEVAAGSQYKTVFGKSSLLSACVTMETCF